MNKDKLKLLIDEIYKNLFESIGKQEHLTKEHIANLCVVNRIVGKSGKNPG